MAKRFTSTEIWNEDWFLEMPSEYKMLWFFMLAKCDHAGVWRPNKKTFEIVTEFTLDLEKCLNYFNAGKDRILVTGKKNWWIIDFFVFQYGSTFNINNKLHKSIYIIYNQENINLRTNRGLKEVKWWTWSGQVEDFDTLKEKDKDSLCINSLNDEKNGKQKLQQFRGVAAQTADLWAERVKRGVEEKTKRNRDEDT